MPGLWLTVCSVARSGAWGTLSRKALVATAPTATAARITPTRTTITMFQTRRAVERRFGGGFRTGSPRPKGFGGGGAGLLLSESVTRSGVLKSVAGGPGGLV